LLVPYQLVGVRDRLFKSEEGFPNVGVYLGPEGSVVESPNVRSLGSLQEPCVLHQCLGPSRQESPLPFGSFLALLSAPAIAKANQIRRSPSFARAGVRAFLEPVSFGGERTAKG